LLAFASNQALEDIVALALQGGDVLIERVAHRCLDTPATPVVPVGISASASLRCGADLPTDL